MSFSSFNRPIRQSQSHDFNPKSDNFNLKSEICNLKFFLICNLKFFFLLFVLTTAAALTVASSAQAPAADVTAVLRGIRETDAGQLAVSEEDGRFLRLLVASRGTRRALEIGAASGYSAIWIGLGLRETGGRLVTIEFDPARAREAADNVRRAGLSDVVQVIRGDGFIEIPKLEGTFDFVFLDAWKPDYRKFFDLVYPRLSPGGLFTAHNVVNKRHEMRDFLDVVTRHPSLWTTIVSPSGEGISLSYRRR